VLDHIVLATNDIAETSAYIAEQTGVTPSPGGAHVGRGTRNDLCSLGHGRYLEIIGPDGQQAGYAGPMPFGLRQLKSWGVATWCSRSTNLQQLIESAAAAGLDLAGPEPMQRDAPEGLLQWELARPTFDTQGGALPFFIDWGLSPHPSETVVPKLDLVSFEAEHPDPPALRSAVEALGEELIVNQAAAPGMRVKLAGPNGEVSLPVARFA